MNTTTTFFWNALEASQLFELFAVTRAQQRFHYAIHKATGAHGMIRFFPYKGEWKKRQGLIVRLSLEPALYGGYDVPKKAKLAMGAHSHPHVVTTMHEKSFLPEESEWAFSHLDQSLKNKEVAPYEWSDDARLVTDWLQGDGRYAGLMPSEFANQPATAAETMALEPLDRLLDWRQDFANRLFSLWHGPISQKQEKEFASIRDKVPLTLGIIHECTPHLKKMQSEVRTAKSQENENILESLMFGPDGFKARLGEIVGFDAVHPALRTSRVYDFVTDYFLRATNYL